VLVAVVADEQPAGHGAGRLQDLHADGSPSGPPRPVADLAAAVAARESAHAPRWVWPATAEIYPALQR